MIYQENKEFKVFTLKAEWMVGDDIRCQYLNDIEVFERNLLDNQEDPENPQLATLPTIMYSEVSLTTDQQEIFDLAKTLNLTLDQIRSWVFDSVIPDSDAYRLYTLQNELIAVKKENVDLMTMLVEGGVL